MKNPFYFILSRPFSMQCVGTRKSSFIFLLLASLYSSANNSPLLAMNPDEEPNESSAMLRKNTQYIEPSWWQSVTIIPTPENYPFQLEYQSGHTHHLLDKEYFEYNEYGNRVDKELPGFQGEGYYERWSAQLTYYFGSTRSCCGCWTSYLHNDDLVAFKSDPSKVMTLASAHNIMNQENREFIIKNREIDRKNKEAYLLYREQYPSLKAEEDYRKAEEERIHQSQMKKINTRKATYDGRYYDLVIFGRDPFNGTRDLRTPAIAQLRKLGVLEKVIEELIEADAARKKRKKLAEWKKMEEGSKRCENQHKEPQKGTQKSKEQENKIKEESATRERANAAHVQASKQEEERREAERQAQERRFRENKQREEQQRINYERQKQQEAELRRQQAQQAAIKRNNRTFF